MATSCGHVERDPEPAPTAPEGFATFVSRWHDIICGEPLECGRYVSEADCRIEAADLTRETERSVAEGRMGYEAEHSEACLAAWLQAYRCRASERGNANLPTILAACAAAFPAKVPAGGVCSLNRECASRHCVQDNLLCDDADGCCSGRCTDGPPPAPPKALGEECTHYYECVTAECSGGVCSVYSRPALPDRGEPCASGCDRSDDHCAEATGVCEPRPVTETAYQWLVECWG